MTNPLHYPDLDRCRELTKIGFPKTEILIDETNDYHTKESYDSLVEMSEFYHSDDIPAKWKVCPSVIEMLDVIPRIIQPLHEFYELTIAKKDSHEYMVAYCKDYATHCKNV